MPWKQWAIVDSCASVAFEYVDKRSVRKRYREAYGLTVQHRYVAHEARMHLCRPLVVGGFDAFGMATLAAEAFHSGTCVTSWAIHCDCRGNGIG
jgi:hypothetical protein